MFYTGLACVIHMILLLTIEQLQRAAIVILDWTWVISKPLTARQATTEKTHIEYYLEGTGTRNINTSIARKSLDTAGSPK